VLRQITRLGISGLEKAESLEQLRWIENGYRIRVGISRFDSIAVDTPEDLLKLLNIH
jgi:3-deoxy-manno-octulosonate cytidylyltransferase (CMP-KDO synthetase)